MSANTAWRGVLALAVAAAGVVAVPGCGSSGNDQAAQQQRLQNARENAAKQQRLQDKLHQLQQQVNKQSTTGGTTTTVPATTSATTTTPASTAGTSCGNGISVGPNTSCPFAVNVKSEYDTAGGGNILIHAFSPTTGQTYEMACGSTGGTIVCTGGNGASVFFPG
jgi:hypothetical protein